MYKLYNYKIIKNIKLESLNIFMDPYQKIYYDRFQSIF